jgi:regulatory protein
MNKITALQISKNRKNVDIFIDGTFSFSIDKELVIKENLKDGTNLSLKRIEQLKLNDLSHKCLHIALSFISRRPRSEKEVRQRLRRSQCTNDTTDRVIAHLKERGLINDAAFAQYWKENRLSFSPRSKSLIKQELRKKGIDNVLADEVANDIDNEGSAYRAAQKKARLLSSLDYDGFHHKLFNYLRYRGFHYEIIERVSERLWQEKNNI